MNQNENTRNSEDRKFKNAQGEPQDPKKAAPSTPSQPAEKRGDPQPQEDKPRS